MIYLNVTLRNPWGGEFKNIKNWFGSTILPNKYWEVQIIKNDHLFRFEFGFTTREDHAGCNLELGLLFYEIHFTIYDNRHWNYEKGKWEVYDNAP